MHLVLYYSNTNYLPRAAAAISRSKSSTVRGFAVGGRRFKIAGLSFVKVVFGKPGAGAIAVSGVAPKFYI